MTYSDQSTIIRIQFKPNRNHDGDDDNYKQSKNDEGAFICKHIH